MGKKIFCRQRERIVFFLRLWNKIVPPRQHFAHRADRAGNMFDTVDNFVFVITENNIAVFSHNFHNKMFDTRIAHLIQVFERNVNNAL